MPGSKMGPVRSSAASSTYNGFTCPGGISAMPLSPNEIEAANRAEATAILIRAGYRVYRPEADVHGEDLVIRAPDGELRSVQMKGRPVVEWRRYSARDIWMLFPDPLGSQPGRPWFFIKHDELPAWVKNRHGAHRAGLRRGGTRE